MLSISVVSLLAEIDGPASDMFKELKYARIYSIISYLYTIYVLVTF